MRTQVARAVQSVPQVRFVVASRLPRWPVWAVALTVVWAGLAAGTAFLSDYLNRPIELCLLKRLTGIPCPTCGSGRAAAAILHGQFVQGWLFNPLVVTLSAVAIAVLLLRLLTGRTIQLRLSRRNRILAWILLAAATLVNWIYVIIRVG